MLKKVSEWISVKIARRPGTVILGAILLFNIIFILLAALVISSFSMSGTERMGFFEAAFYTITMILDAGCIQFVIEDIGKGNVAIAILCLLVIFIGMISFTGAVIGYITNLISKFISDSNEGSRKLKISDHIVILNWNTRASEIINDMLYGKKDFKVVVLNTDRKSEIEKEIEERLSDTISREPNLRKNVQVIVREGDVFSSKQLNDISIASARTIIILGSDINNTLCQYGLREKMDDSRNGNSQTIKTLMQVADITAADTSWDDQKIIVEITDDWTLELVEKIKRAKQVDGKCNIVPINVNNILGQILSQFSLMPELNLAYRELFSNKGMTFFSVGENAHTECAEPEMIDRYLMSHKHAIPLAIMEHGGVPQVYFAAEAEKDISRVSVVNRTDYKVELNYDYWIDRKNVVILGHNGNSEEIMRGFEAFRSEWNYSDGNEILKILVIDDKDSLEKMNYYKKYPFVEKTVEASIYDKDIISKTIEDFYDANTGDISVLILSDDEVLNEELDANALTNLVYVRDIIENKKEENPGFDVESIDVIVEIIEPKHHDIVSSYSINNVVISNRYISKMIMQVGEKEALFDFYNDILTYDTDEGRSGYESKEIYTKKVGDFFKKIPEETDAEQFIRAVYYASIDPSIPKEKQNPTIPLGYVKPGGEMVVFGGNQSEINVKLEQRDKLIVFSNH